MSSPWDAFGGDSESDEDVLTSESSVNSVAAALLVRLRRERSTSWRRIRLAVADTAEEEWSAAILARGLEVGIPIDGLCDAVIWDGAETLNDVKETIVPGGYFVGPTSASFPMEQRSANEMIESLWKEPIELCPKWSVWERLSCCVALETCPWLPGNTRHVQEPEQMSVVPLSSSERKNYRMDDSARSKVVDHVRESGYCVIPGLLNPESCHIYGKAILEDMHAAADIIHSKGGNLYQPTATATGTYREISLREDWRLDLRDGPTLRRVRQGQPDFLRRHPDLLAICESLMFPSDLKLAAGNYGKYNFSLTLQERLSTSAVGGIVSLPGSADQAIHADTPHLFEVGNHLPPHYINFFAGAISADQGVGPTALIHGSHRREYVAQYHVDEVLQPAVWNDIVRPRLQVGDVLVMDCRILHFGVANTHLTIERPLLYSNVTSHWFHDPKNWDDRERIFEDIS